MAGTTAAFCIFLTSFSQNKNVFARSTSWKNSSRAANFGRVCKKKCLARVFTTLIQNICRSRNRRWFYCMCEQQKLRQVCAPEQSRQSHSKHKYIKKTSTRNQRCFLLHVRATKKLRRVCAFEQSRLNLCYPHSKHKCI